MITSQGHLSKEGHVKVWIRNEFWNATKKSPPKWKTWITSVCEAGIMLSLVFKEVLSKYCNFAIKFNWEQIFWKSFKVLLSLFCFILSGISYKLFKKYSILSCDKYKVSSPKNSTQNPNLAQSKPKWGSLLPNHLEN